MRIWKIIQVIEVAIIISLIGDYYLRKIETKYKCSMIKENTLLNKDILKTEKFTQESNVKYMYYNAALVGLHTCSIEVKENTIISSKFKSIFYLF